MSVDGTCNAILHQFVTKVQEIAKLDARELQIGQQLGIVDGQEFLEYSEVESLPNWLGLLRIIQPAATLQGLIVFDVPVSDYQLRVTDGGDLESEKTALVDIPLSFGAPDPIQMPGESTMD